MPIIPSNWTGLNTVNAIGLSGGSGGLTGYAYAKQLTTTITELDTFIDLIGPCNEPISREVSLDLITGRLKLYWKNLDGTYTQLHRDNLIFNTGYKVVDLTLGQLGLSIKCSEVTELFLVLRWDKDIEFDLYSEPVPPTPLITVIDNTFFINETINMNYPDGVTCYAYFIDNPALTPELISDWEQIIVNSQPVRQTEQWQMYQGYDANPQYICPTIDNQYQFKFYPEETLSGNISFYYWGDQGEFFETLRIISFNSTTNTFILGLV